MLVIITSSAQTAWLTKGNNGINPSKDFIGTRDAQPLVFKVNNQRSGYLDLDSFSQITAFGYQTLISNVPSNVDGLPVELAIAHLATRPSSPTFPEN